MNADEILKLVGLAVSALPALVEAGINIADRVSKIKELADAGANATPEQIKTVRDQLDADLDEFDAPI